MKFYVGRAVRITGHHWHIGRHAHIEYIGTDGRARIRDSYGIGWMSLDDLEPCEHTGDAECAPNIPQGELTT
jgi:hypothetical protein